MSHIHENYGQLRQNVWQKTNSSLVDTFFGITARHLSQKEFTPLKELIRPQRPHSKIKKQEYFYYKKNSLAL